MTTLLEHALAFGVGSVVEFAAHAISMVARGAVATMAWCLGALGGIAWVALAQLAAAVRGPRVAQVAEAVVDVASSAALSSLHMLYVVMRYLVVHAGVALQLALPWALRTLAVVASGCVEAVVVSSPYMKVAAAHILNALCALASYTWAGCCYFLSDIVVPVAQTTWPMACSAASFTCHSILPATLEIMWAVTRCAVSLAAWALSQVWFVAAQHMEGTRSNAVALFATTLAMALVWACATSALQPLWRRGMRAATLSMAECSICLEQRVLETTSCCSQSICGVCIDGIQKAASVNATVANLQSRGSFKCPFCNGESRVRW